MSDTMFFPELLADEEREKSEAAERAAIESRKDHIQTMRCCWPEWDGPRVEDSIHGRCSVGACIVFSETHGENRYFYTEPCRILEIGPDMEWVRAVIDHPPEAPLHVRDDNGTIVKMDITEVWPPVAELWALRDAEERGAA